MGRMFVVVVALALSACTSANATDVQQPAPSLVASIPTEKCTPLVASEATSVESIRREGDNATEGRRMYSQMNALLASLPAGSRNMPIGDQLNSRQSAEFAELASQIRIHQFNHLAESRLQRDAELIASAAAVIEKLREGDSDGLASEDPNGHGLALIYLLRVAIEKDEQTLTGPPDAPTCSLDSALSRGQQAAYASVNRLLNSSEAHQLDVLRKRYAASDQLNPETLPSPDREKAIWLTKAVVEPSGREAVAVTDYENLRRFARVSALRYQEQRDAIISGAGSEKYDYGSGLRKLYSDADDLTKHTLNVWLLIDEKVPSTAAIEDQQKLEILRKASGVEKSK